MRKFATLVVFSWPVSAPVSVPSVVQEEKKMRLWFWSNFDINYETAIRNAKSRGAPDYCHIESYSRFPIGAVKLSDIINYEPVLLDGNIIKA